MSQTISSQFSVFVFDKVYLYLNFKNVFDPIPGRGVGGVEVSIPARCRGAGWM